MRIIAFLLTIVLFSCQDTSFYNQAIAIDQEGWEYGKAISFEVDLQDTSSVFEMHLTVEHKDSYSYENLYLKITTAFPTIESRDETLNIELAEKTGNWIGKCNSGNCKIKVYLLENFKFPEQGNYRFSFEQYTRDTVLKDIDALQFTLYKKDGLK